MQWLKNAFVFSRQLALILQLIVRTGSETQPCSFFVIFSFCSLSLLFVGLDRRAQNTKGRLFKGSPQDLWTKNERRLRFRLRLNNRPKRYSNAYEQLTSQTIWANTLNKTMCTVTVCWASQPVNSINYVQSYGSVSNLDGMGGEGVWGAYEGIVLGPKIFNTPPPDLTLNTAVNFIIKLCKCTLPNPVLLRDERCLCFKQGCSPNFPKFRIKCSTREKCVISTNNGEECK